MIEWVMCGALRWFGHVMRMSDNDCEESVKGRWINKVDEHWRVGRYGRGSAGTEIVRGTSAMAN